ncbi:MAG: hypothetical protein LC802_21140 [Acidobacteria bacterium]|nr:hypothetical protein [Acidobacteriota bacterium]
MDDTKRRIEITVERQRIVLIKRRTPSTPVWCETCAERPLMLTPDEAARLLDMTERDIYRRVEARQVHFTETAGGRLYVCGSSLQD